MARSQKSRPSAARPAPLGGNDEWKRRSRVRTTGPALRTEASAWDRLPGGAQHAVCIGFLLVVALGFFAPTTFGGKAFAGGDTVQWRATAQASLDAEAATGEAPLWVPTVFGGMPTYLVTYPARVPGADTLVSALRGLGLWPVAHFFVLLLGTYLLVVYLTRTKLPGVVAAVGFGLSTYLPIILTAGHNTKFVALAYAPWLLLAFAAVVRREPGTKRMVSGLLTLLFAIAAATNLRAGHVQITYYAVVIAAVWWIAEGIAAWRGGTLKTFAFSTGLLALGSALALALVAQPYLAQWQFKAFTTRGAAAAGGGMAWDYAMEWSQGWGELLTLVIPNAYGGGGALYWGPKVFTAGPHYVGPVVALLALIGAVGVARRSVVAFVAAALLMTGFALGDHFEILNRAAFAGLPLFSTFRVPETWLAAVALVIALLAGWGGYYLQRREATPEAEARKRRVAWGAIAVFAVLIGGLWITGGAGLSFEKPGEAAQIEQAAAAQLGLSPTDPQVAQVAQDYLRQQGITPEARQAAFSADAGRSLLFLVLAAACVSLLALRRAPAFVGLAVLALLATADLWGVGRRYVSDESPALQRRRDVADVLRAQQTDADRFLAERARAAGSGAFRVLPQNPLSTAGPSYYAESVGGYNGVRLANVESYLTETLPDPETGFNRNALRLLAVRYVVAQGAIPGLVPVFQDPASGQVVSEDSAAAPRAYLVDRVEVVPDAAAVRARVRDPQTDLTRTAFVADIPGASAAALSGAPPDSGRAGVRLDRFSPDEIVWRVRTDRPRLFVASEVYYPAGWTATVGEADAPIVEVDGLIRGVPVPAGDHLVTMRFRPAAHRDSLIVSWVAFFIAYGGAVALASLLWLRRGARA
ncbi:MAG TPA: hypothetical protein VGB53_04825 [Rubricoccaceae bacterium]|jgi:hypothetical protein